MSSHDKLGRILLVDDEREQRKLFGTLMLRAGLPFDTCASAAEARQRLASNGICLVIIDMLMPDEGGASLAQWIAEKMPHVHFLLISGDESSLEDAVAYTTFTKPFDNKNFVDLLRSILFEVKMIKRMDAQDVILAEIRARLNPTGIFQDYVNDKFLMMIAGLVIFIAGACLKKVLG